MNTKQAWSSVVLMILMVAGSSQLPEVRMRGHYRNNDHKAQLEITSDKMVLKGNPATDMVSLDYKVLKVTGSDLTVELTLPDGTSKPFHFNMVISVRDDLLYFEPRVDHVGGLLGEGGTWTRK